MRLYDGSVQDFKNDVINNQIADKLGAAYLTLRKRNVSQSEYRSWKESLNYFRNVLDYSELKNIKVVLEYEPPYSENRIDVLLFGKDTEQGDNVVLIELKQWSNDKIKDCETDGNVLVNYGSHIDEREHPSLQAQGYYYQLKDYLSVFEEKSPMFLSACAYCHNYKKGSNAVIYLPKFEKMLKHYPLFSTEDVKELGEYLKDRLSRGDGFEVLNRFDKSVIRPSKKLLIHTKEMINKQQIFNLIDSQIAAYNSIMYTAKKLSNINEKAVIIVKGGPGTGKSVIALEVMGELLRLGKDVYHATGSSAFTNTLRKILGKRAAQRFKFFYNFSDKGENEISVLICDEAHRIRKDSFDFRVPSKYKSRSPQIDDLIRPAKLSVFFIDEHQVVRPKEVGSLELITEAAKRHHANISIFDLKVQFRCGGSEAYLQWLENLLGIRESEIQNLTKSEKMEFKIVESPEKLKEIIKSKNTEKPNSARIVAGFCWKWSDPNSDGTLVNDVKIGSFEMPWEKKNAFWKWATDESGMDQIGTVYTSQGFEFDYIGVIFGNDLVYNPKSATWESKSENSHDNTAKRGNAELVKHLKNVYRVLMSRAHKGVYVYFIDKDTENFFRSKIEIK